MESRAKLFGHAIHPILIVFPLGLLATAVVFDVVHLISGGSVYAVVAYWMMTAGLIGGVLAAPFGWYDWFAAIPSNTRAKYVGLIHGLTMSLTLVLFFFSWWLRNGLPERPEALASIFSFIGAATALFGGWLGGELVERLGIGVVEGANANAPSSLSHPSPRTDNVHANKI